MKVARPNKQKITHKVLTPSIKTPMYILMGLWKWDSPQHIIICVSVIGTHCIVTDCMHVQLPTLQIATSKSALKVQVRNGVASDPEQVQPQTIH